MTPTWGDRVGLEEVAVDIKAIRTPSLGDTTFVLTHGKSALVVDPQRDIDRFLEETNGATITHVLETHVHNDYVSGGRDLARTAGADLVLPAGSGVGFAFVPAFHLEDLSGDGGLTIRPIHTPGHTPEHVSYAILVDGVIQALFSGGSLLVGAAGRPDLLGDEFAHQLAVLQYGSLQRLALLPDEVDVFPTHGEGSFCSSSAAGRSTSTIGREKADNPLFEYDEAETFARDQLAGLLPYPRYYAHMAPINRTDPTAMAVPAVPELDPDAVADLLEVVSVLDGRSRYAYAEGHIPGALGVELGTAFAPWAGWLLPFNVPLVLVLDDDQPVHEAAIELARIGFTDIRGVMRGMTSWRAAGRPVETHGTATAAELFHRLSNGDDLQVVDVRDPQEWRDGHIEGSVHRYVPEFLAGPGELNPERPAWLICRTGSRASVASGLAHRTGIAPIVVAEGGVATVLAAQSGR